MTLTLELPSEVERVLENGARASGQSVAAYAAQLLTEAAEEAADVAEAARRLQTSDPSQRRTLAELRAAVFDKSNG